MWRSSFWTVIVCVQVYASWRKQPRWHQRISQHLPVFCYRNYTFKWYGNFLTDFVLFAVVHDIAVMQLTVVSWLVVFRAMWNMGNRRRRCITKSNVVSVYIAVWLPETVLRTVNVSSSWRICVHLCYSHKYHRYGYEIQCFRFYAVYPESRMSHTNTDFGIIDFYYC